MIPASKLTDWANSLTLEETKGHIAISDNGLFLEVIGRDGERNGNRLEIGTWNNDPNVDALAE